MFQGIEDKPGGWGIIQFATMRRTFSSHKPSVDEGFRRLLPEESAKITRILASLLDSCEARSAVLVGMGGQEMASAGNIAEFDREALCSLSASAMAATQSLAGLIGEETFQGVYHKGKVSSVLILPVGDEAILLLVLENREREKRSSLEISRAAMVLRDLLESNVTSDRASDGP